MTPQEIIEGNKLIAEFDGWKDTGVLHPYGRSKFNMYEHHDKFGQSWIEKMKYNSSWDWLMPAVEKVESLGFYFNIKKNHVVVARDNKDTRDSEIIHSEWGDQSKIERVFQCAVAFVKYCNQNKPV